MCKGQEKYILDTHGLRTYVTSVFSEKLFEDLFGWLRDESILKTQQLEKSYKMSIK